MIKGDKEAKSLILFPVSREDYIVLHIIANATMSEERKNICLPDKIDNIKWSDSWVETS